MTLMLQLDSPFLDSLRQEAEALGVSLEELAKTVLQDHARLREGNRRVADDATFRAALSASVTEHAELLRRLAQ